MNAKVVDLDLRRLAKAFPVEPAAGPSTTTEVVRLIACYTCHSSEFRLAHDGRVVCAGCCCEIAGCRWFDENKPEPPAA